MLPGTVGIDDRPEGKCGEAFITPGLQVKILNAVSEVTQQTVGEAAQEPVANNSVLRGRRSPPVSFQTQVPNRGVRDIKVCGGAAVSGLRERYPCHQTADAPSPASRELPPGAGPVTRRRSSHVDFFLAL